MSRYLKRRERISKAHLTGTSEDEEENEYNIQQENGWEFFIID